MDGPFPDWEPVRYVGMDSSCSRYGDVDLYRCKACGRLWLRYFVDWANIPRTNRWIRGLIDEETAASIKPEEAADYILGLEWYVFGGPRYEHLGKRGSGPFEWYW